MASEWAGTAQTRYNDDEGAALVAPLVGWPAEDIAAFVVVTIDRDGKAGFGSSGVLRPKAIPKILRTLADGIEAAVREVQGG